MIFARATPEKAKVTETYEVDQVISVNPRRTRGRPHPGRIEITVPYDGLRYFTQQAARDVEHARGGSHRGGPEVTVGHLLLAEHDQVESLPAGVRVPGEHGILPVTVSLQAAADLTAGRKSSVLTHEYQPRYPQIIPAELEIDVMDPDALDYMSLAEALEENSGDLAFLTKAVGEMRQKITFGNVLMLRMRVRVSLPHNPERPNVPTLRPIVRRISIDWPTITSLRTTQLDVYAAVEQDGQQTQEADWREFPVRYNPVDRRLEWEMLVMGRAAANGDGGRARTIDYSSPQMRLLIGHPGELYRTAQLRISAEVEIPGYLLSGLDPRLFDAVGRVIPAGAETGRASLPALSTRVIVNGTLFVDQAFARRDFSPHHNVVFDDIIPDEMRVTDIVNVLKSLGFSDIENKWQDTRDPDAPQWFLRASRSRGPDQMALWIYVEGTRHILERQQIMGDSRVKTTGSRASGQIRLHMLGRLPREHQEMTREMNALQKALRDRYQYQMAWRR